MYSSLNNCFLILLQLPLRGDVLILMEVNPFLDGISKVKDLIQELEESFRESSIVGNNLILRCVLLRAENQNLIHKIDEKNRNLTTTLWNKHWQLSFLTQGKTKCVNNDTKRITCSSHSKTSLQRVSGSVDEIDILHKTIGDLQNKLKERDSKIESLCQKYLYLKTNKNKMEVDLKSEISSLKNQLDVTCNTLIEFQNEVEEVTEKSLSLSKNTYEALFLQEKLRCSKLMYEKVRLHHEIKSLENIIRNQAAALDENKCSEVFRSSLDKCNSEPYMRHL